MQVLTSKLTSLCSTLEETGLTQVDFKAAKVPMLAEDGDAVPIKKQLSQATPAQVVDLCRQRLTVSLPMQATLLRGAGACDHSNILSCHWPLVTGHHHVLSCHWPSQCVILLLAITLSCLVTGHHNVLACHWPSCPVCH